MTKKPFVRQSTLASGLLDLIHSNVCGPLNTQARGGFSYFITFINDHSRAFKDCGPDAILDMARFVGYPKETVGYYFYDPSEQKVFVLRNAVFLEKYFEADTHCEELLLEESSEVTPQMDAATSSAYSPTKDSVLEDRPEPKGVKRLGINGSTNVSLKLRGGYYIQGQACGKAGQNGFLNSLLKKRYIWISRRVSSVGERAEGFPSPKMLDVYVILVGGRQRLSSRLNCLEGSYHMEALEALSLEDVVTTVGSKIEPVTYQYMTVESPISSEMVRALRACGHSD
ncbi:hypothetical protein Sango_3042100 [Sesamum angolense]|uniref:Retroviral polymerase SH3-like domain-containing protein n=1 Tax=Sesamum angolense TaxID=2727404 RepID=A0AAE1W1D5_9LAMI|nr:hypothetical protein Sango_3042100 [Sesamum angolense]